jgi:predicted O-methyltransferase YrrM
MLFGRMILFRPFQPTPEQIKVPFVYRWFRHPLWGWLGLRPVFAQHTQVEHEALIKWAKGRKSIVEIGVAEGASALALRKGMDSSGTLYLIDPFHLSRFPLLNAMKRLAKRTVNYVKKGKVVWIEKFSFEAVKDWKIPIDLLFIDGDHSYEGVLRDWEDWSPFVVVGGIVIFHDARVFPNGWVKPNDGPVRVVNQLFRKSSTSEWKIIEEVHSMVIVQRQK